MLRTSFFYAFKNCVNLIDVNISENVSIIRYDSFGLCSGIKTVTIYNPEIQLKSFTFTTKATIHGWKNSTAQAYAEKHNMNFVELSCNDEHTWDNGVNHRESCDEDGTTTYTCTVCGDTKSEVYPAVNMYGHMVL